MSLTRACLTVMTTDLRVLARKPAEALTALVFFVIVASLFPLAVSPEPALLRLLAPGVPWVAALLATLLSLNRLFAADLADGTLEQLLLSPHPLAALVGAKVFAHWLATGLPLVLLAPVVAIALHLPEAAIPGLMLSLLLGTPVLSLIGAIGAALTLGVRGGGVLLALVVLPLYTPLLIFGALTVASAGGATGIMGAQSYLSLLAAMLCLSVVFAPLATAAALRVSLD